MSVDNGSFYDGARLLSQMSIVNIIMKLTKSLTAIAIVSALTFSQSTLVHAAETKAKQESASSWLSLSAKELKAVERYASEYKDYIYKTPTELTFVTETIKRVEKQGFKKFSEKSKITPGARFYDVNRDRAITLMVIGEEPLEQGTRIVGAHIDAPRLELKGRPLFEKQEFAMFQTYIHGGIKTYQWVSRDVIGKEELDVIVAAKPELDKKIKDQVKDYLMSEYNISIEDLVSAELALVPATKPRDVGFDRSMIAAYGQDDKASSIAAVKALTEQKVPTYTAIAYLVDNEEVGNINNTGASSTYLVDLISGLLYNEKGDSYNDYQLRKVLRNTKVISADVNPGVNPTWSSVWELGNAPRLGNGVNLKLYGGGFNANSEYMAWTRNYLDNADIKWQTSTYKGKASGGTIGSDLSNDNMEVIDFGIPILSIHSPYAVGSKVDLYSLYKAMSAFYQEK